MKIKIMNNNEKRLDVIVALILGIGLWVTLYFFIGFYKFGLNTPYIYAGGDDLTELTRIKSIGENGWFWENEYIGAPYEQEQFDFPAAFAANIENIFAKIMYVFANDAVVVQNLQFLLNFALSGVVSFFVFRKLSLDRLVSSLFAVLFGLSPYIFGRGVWHLTLGAVYFVPLTVLLCIWCFEEDENYLRFSKNFFKSKKNVATILFSFLIANNGIAYYQYFSCFFLCVVAMHKICVMKSWKALLQPLKVIALIVFFLGGALLPVAIFEYINGSVGIADRHISAPEMLGLKIAQMFIPLNDHGIGWLKELISEYNQNMPFVNENNTAYIGISGIIGFICVLFGAFINNSGSQSSLEDSCKSSDTQRVQLLSKLVVFAILLATIGGFSSLLSLLGLRAIRGYNRISIYIMFLCLCVSGIYVQKIKKWCYLKSKKNYKLFLFAFAFAGMFMVWEQLPTWGARDSLLAENQKKYSNDAEFIAQIENQMQEGDLIYQLPYHIYPEGETIHNMTTYQLLTGYIHSETLKWSYGGIKGRESDRWNKYVAQLPVEKKVETIIPAGFRGIYIDSRAYKQEELEMLMASIEEVVGQKPSKSQDGVLLFYNLYPYIQENPHLLEQKPVVLDELRIGDIIWFCSEKCNSSLLDIAGLYEKEELLCWTKGNEFSMNFILCGAEENNLHAEFDVLCVYNNQQRVNVYVNDECVYSGVFAGGLLEFDFERPQDNRVNIRVELPDAISPNELNGSADTRVLALGLKNFCVSTESIKNLDILERETQGTDVHKLEISEKIWFYSDTYNASMYNVKGIYEKEEVLSWTKGKEMNFNFELSGTKENNLHAEFDVLCVYNNQQRVTVYVNDKCVYSNLFSGGLLEFDFERPQDNRVSIRVELPDAISPSEISESTDTRVLALGLKSFCVIHEE